MNIIYVTNKYIYVRNLCYVIDKKFCYRNTIISDWPLLYCIISSAKKKTKRRWIWGIVREDRPMKIESEINVNNFWIRKSNDTY